jgi:hypothetical protein
MNTDEHDFRVVIAEADPCGEGGAWLLSVGQPVVGGFLDGKMRQEGHPALSLAIRCQSWARRTAISSVRNYGVFFNVNSV